MNTTFDTIFSHRSIREFDGSKLSDEVLGDLFKAALFTSTSTGTQACSIITVTDESIQRQIADVSKQEFIAHAPHLFIFVVDSYRNSRIAEENGVEPVYANGMDIFFQGFSDACIMAQNMLLAAESIGLGGCLLGSILNDPAQICSLLSLPELTFPAVGLVVGKPSSKVVLSKPRLDVSLRVFENKYEVLDSYSDHLVGYDKVMADYFMHREGILEGRSAPRDFTKIVLARLTSDLPMRRRILDFVRSQGFDLGVDL